MGFHSLSLCDTNCWYQYDLVWSLVRFNSRALIRILVSTVKENIFFIGNGKYAYMEATGRQHGDKARIVSPTMQGPKCLSMMYHMYGTHMGSLIIYMKTNSSETVEWIKTGNHPDQWLEAAVFINSSVDYQVIHCYKLHRFQWAK